MHQYLLTESAYSEGSSPRIFRMRQGMFSQRSEGLLSSAGKPHSKPSSIDLKIENESGQIIR